MEAIKLTPELAGSLEDGGYEAFEKFDEFLQQFEKGGVFENSRRTAFHDCARHYGRFYLQRYLTGNVLKRIADGRQDASQSRLSKLLSFLGDWSS